MWIKGKRRGGAKDLSAHLQNSDENESVTVREIKGFSFDEQTIDNFDKALRQMEAIGYGKGAKRNLYHVILAPAYGETLDAKRREAMVDYYAEQMGFKNHQRVVVEHWKKGKQHFHVVFNIVHPTTGKIHELKWTKRKEWRISRALEDRLGLAKHEAKGKSAKTWQMQRGKRTGIDPRKMRKEVTAIFHASKTSKDFIAALEKAGYALTRGRRNQLVLVDRLGDTHGLMRLIEGKKLADLRAKFQDIDSIKLPDHADLVKARKPKRTYKARRQRKYINPQRLRSDVRKAYRTSKNGKVFYKTLRQKDYQLGRGFKSYAVIDANGHRYDLKNLLGAKTVKDFDTSFPDLAGLRLPPASAIIRRLKTVYERGDSTGGVSSAKINAKPKQSKLRQGSFSGRGSGGGVSTPHYSNPSSLTASFRQAASWAKYRRQQEEKQQPMPMRPVAHGSMCEAQRIDLEAAIDGKITWAEYFRKWGGGQPSP